MNTKIDSAYREQLQSLLMKYLKQNGISLTKAAEMLSIDVRNFDRALKTETASLERLERFIRRLNIPFNASVLLGQAVLQSKVDLELEKESVEIAKNAKDKGLRFLEVVRLVRSYLLQNKYKYGVVSDEEIDELNKAALMIVADPIRLSFPVTIYRERTEDGFKFFRLEKSNLTFSVSDDVLFQFGKNYGLDFFYNDVVLTSLCDQDEIKRVTDIITLKGEIVWRKEK